MQGRGWKIGTLLPWLLALALAGDLVSRLLPLDVVAFRVWEPALRTTLLAPGPFEPGKVVHKHGAYGDLAAMGNFPRVRQPHDEEFHVDRLGFRNGYDIDHTRYAGIVAGDSFAVAHAELEPETLSGQLTRLSGARFYNAGSNISAGPPSPELLDSLATNLRIRPGVVVYELLERVVRGAPPEPAGSTIAAVFPESWDTRWIALVHRFSPTVESPLHIATVRALKRLQDDVLEPNSYASAVVRGTLANGDEMLFIPWDVPPVGDFQARATVWAQYLTSYAAKLREHGLPLVVLLVPNKYTVYAPLTAGGPREPEGARLLRELADRLRVAGLPAVDVTPLFTAQAAAGLERHEYLYWRDDTHWNEKGIELAAEAVWQEVGPRSGVPGR